MTPAFPSSLPILLLLLTIPLHAQQADAPVAIPLANPGNFAGQWEDEHAEVGIYLDARTEIEGQQEVVTSLSILLFRYLNGHKVGGWNQEGYQGNHYFDGRFLRISGRTKASMSADLAWQEDRQQWSGTIEVDGKTRAVILRRPRSQGTSPFLGDWVSTGEPPASGISIGGEVGCLHIWQNFDGQLQAWINSAAPSPDLRSNRKYGELLQVHVPKPQTIWLDTTFNWGSEYHFEGTLNEAQNHFTGGWNPGRTAPGTFARAKPGECSHLPTQVITQ